MSGQIFISYRREDSAAWAGRLSDRLKSHLPTAQIFMDVDNIEPGADFVQAIEDIVSACDVLIAVIGHRWLTSSDHWGKRRLDNPQDLVRLEVATALKRGIRVVPVLVEGAKIPKAGQLPNDLKLLVRRNALEIGHTRFNSDSENLIAAVERALGEAIEHQRKLETKDQLDSGLSREEEQQRIPDPSQLPASLWASRSRSPENGNLRRVLAVVVPVIVVFGLAVIAAVYLNFRPPKVTEPRALAVQPDLKPRQESAGAVVPSPSISATTDSKQTALLSELKGSPDGVLRVKTNEDGSFKSLVVKASVGIGGAEKDKRIVQNEVEVEGKKYLAEWLKENCIFVRTSNDMVTIQTKGESARDAAGKTVKVRNPQGQEFELLTETSATLAEAALKGLFVVSSEVEDTRFVLLMALTEKSLDQGGALAKALTAHPASPEKTGLPTPSGDNDRPTPERKLNRDILKDLE
jgi:TIR domain